MVAQAELEPYVRVREGVQPERLDGDPGPVCGLEDVAGLDRLLLRELGQPPRLLRQPPRLPPQAPREDGVDDRHARVDGGRPCDDRVAGLRVHAAWSVARGRPAGAAGLSPADLLMGCSLTLETRQCLAHLRGAATAVLPA